LENDSTEIVQDLDVEILRLLQEDSRLSYNKIARKLGISVGTAFNHTKSLEKRGVLKGYTIVVDSEKMGFELTVLVLIQAEGGHIADIEDEIKKTANVLAIYNLTGDYDAAAIIKFKGRENLSLFLKHLLSTPHVRRTVTNVALDVVKEELNVKLQAAQKEPGSAEAVC
jgi:Lrp/AsnC family transcriptional regulator, regulator for asnA, asnC and gidA